MATVAVPAAPFVLASLRFLILGPAGRDDQSVVASRADGFGPSYLDEITIRHDTAGAEPAAGMRAESPGDLGQRLEGRWVAMRPASGRLTPGAGVEFRDGAVLSPDYPAVVGEYRALSRSTLRVDDTTSGRTVVFEVWFPSASAMTWRVSVNGVERGRIVFARA